MQSESGPPPPVASARVIIDPDIDTLEDEIKSIEEGLAAVGDDTQLATLDLQNVLQKQQQMLQMLSNVSKMLYDTAMTVIRKIEG
jgi:hypothetical protein